MAGSKSTDHHHRLRLKDGGDCAELEAGSGVACSICLELVSENGVRSRVKLQCGHEFHLDCIGSAFNMKGAMECPNCRNVEKGQWLYANGANGANRASGPTGAEVLDMNLEALVAEEDLYDQSYAEMPPRVQWCPYTMARLRSSFGGAGFPSATNNGLHGHHAASSVPHSYMAANFRLIPPSSNAADGVDDPYLNHRWNDFSGPNDIFDPRIWAHDPYIFRPSAGQMNRADPGSVALGSQRSTQSDPDVLARAQSFAQQLMSRADPAPAALALERSMHTESDTQSFAHQLMNRADLAPTALAAQRSMHSEPDALARSHSVAHQFLNRVDTAPVALASQRYTPSESDVLARSQSLGHQFFFGHGSGPGAGSSFVSSVVPHLNSNARPSETVHISRVVYHGDGFIPGTRRGMPAVAPALPPNHGNNFYAFPPSPSGQNVHEPGSPSHQVRDSDWQAFLQAPGGTDPGNQPNNFPRHWSWRN